MLLTDVQPYDSGVLHMSISTKTYWWRQFLSNGGNLFVYLIDSTEDVEGNSMCRLSEYSPYESTGFSN